MARSSRTAGGVTIASNDASMGHLASRAAGLEMGDYFEPGQGLGMGDEFDVDGVSVPAGFNVENIDGEDVRGMTDYQTGGPVRSYMVK
jgi:hypothetical protein